MTNREAVAAGAAAYKAGAPRACPIPYPASTPGSAESRAWSTLVSYWFRGWDIANLAAELVDS